MIKYLGMYVLFLINSNSSESQKVLGNKKTDICIQNFFEKRSPYEMVLQLMESLSFHCSIDQILQHARKETKIPNYNSFSKIRTAK